MTLLSAESRGRIFPPLPITPPGLAQTTTSTTTTMTTTITSTQTSTTSEENAKPFDTLILKPGVPQSIQFPNMNHMELRNKNATLILFIKVEDGNYVVNLAWWK